MSIKRNDKDFPYIDLGNGFMIYVQAEEYTDPALKAKAEKELNETPENVEKSLSELRTLLKTDKDLFVPVENDPYLITFLRANQYIPQKTFQMIQNAYRLKSKSKEYYENTPNPSSIRHVFDEGMIWFMPERDANDGAAICVVEVGSEYETRAGNLHNVRTVRIYVKAYDHFDVKFPFTIFRSFYIQQEI